MRPSRLHALPLYLATLPLAPLLLAQGRWVRWRVPKLPEPDGAREGSVGTGHALRLLILGDSAAAGVGADHQAEALSGRLVEQLGAQLAIDWQLRARSGDRCRDALAALRADPQLRCDVALLSIGVNDATALASPRRFADDMTALLEHLRRRVGAGLIVLSGLPPVGQFPALPQPLRWRLGAQARRLDRVLQRLAADSADCLHLPFGPLPDAGVMARDGFHPGPPVYRLWAAAAAAPIIDWQRRRQAPGA